MRMPRHHIAASILLVFASTSGCTSESSLVKEGEEIREPVELEETFLQAPQSKVDILWVVDDTSSMADEHAALESAFAVFASTLSGLELSWQMGVITTDISGGDAGVLRGDPWILTPTLADLEAELQEAAAVGTDGSSPEAGLGAAFLALSEPLRSGDNRAFRRDDASLHVVIVSDTDDDSADVLGDEPAAAFATFLAEEAERSGQPAMLSAMVGDAPDGCTWDGGSAEAGARYLEVAAATGGAQASICSPDLSAVAANLGDLSAVWPDTFALQAVPDPDSVRVWVDDERLSDGFAVVTDPSQIVFDAPPAAGVEIRVRYEVAE